MAENFANEYQTTLNGALDASQTSVVVTSATGAPAANFRIRIDNEYMLVTAVAGTTFTVTRAVEGSTGAAHTDAATVTHVLTAGGLDQALSETTPGWTTYTPTLTALTTNPTLGNGTLTGRYRMLAVDSMQIEVRFVRGSTGTNGSGRYQISMPSGYTAAAEQWLCGGIDDSGTRAYIVHARIASGTSIFNFWHTESTGVGWIDHSAPVTWATGDYIAFNGILRVVAA